jgi:hypothetical protein
MTRSLALLTAVAATSAASAGIADVRMSEFRIAQPGLDVDQYVELVGEPGTSLDGLQFVVVGDLEGAFPPEQNGGVEIVVDLSGVIPEDGIFLLASPSYSLGGADQIANLDFESGENLTFFIADGFSGMVGDTVDADADGTLDKGAISVVDSLAVLADQDPDGFGSEFYYSDTTIGPIAGFSPLHGWRCSDTLVWRPGSDAVGGVNETPGLPNATCDGGGGGGPDGLILNELRIDHSGADNDEFFELKGDPNASLDGYAVIAIGDGAVGSGAIESISLLDGYQLNAEGYFVGAKSTFTLGIPDGIFDDLQFENSDTVTIFLVLNFTGELGGDIDADDDGVIDAFFWDEIVDGVSILETCEEPPTTTEWGYAAVVVPPDGIYAAGGIFRCEPSGDWTIGGFSFGDYSQEHTPGTMNIECDSVGCGGLARSCFEAQDGPGCSDIVICELVCEADSACCSAEWDSNCASLATAYLADGDPPAVAINEFRTKQPGGDDDEYVEIIGDPGESLDGLSVVFIGSDGCEPNGVVVHQYNLIGQTIPGSGYFVMGDPTLSLGTGSPDYPIDIEIIDGGNLTAALVWNFVGARGGDLDVDNDCTLDATPWASTVGDVVAMIGDSSGNCVYLNAIEVGPDNIYTPAHVYKCASGEWDWGAFDPALGVDTPGLANLECGAPPALCGDSAAGDCFEIGSAGCDDEVCCDLVTSLDPFCATDSWDETCVSHALNMCLPLGNAPEIRIAEIRIDQPGADVDEFIEIRGEPGTSLDGVSVLVVGDGAGGCGSLEVAVPLGGVTISGNGTALVSTESFTLASLETVRRFAFENSDNLTFLLVFGFVGESGMDLDTDDDSELDVTPWESIIDAVSLVETPDEGDCYYADVQIGPDVDIDDNAFVPAQVWACDDSGAWNIGTFDPASTDPPAADTPGVVNDDCGGGDVCPGDFNDDGEVNGSDFGFLLAAWGPCPGCPEDMNGDGEVSGADVGLLLSVWGVCP